MHINEERVGNDNGKRDPVLEVKLMTAILVSADDLIKDIIKDRRVRARFAEIYPYIEDLRMFSLADLQRVLPPDRQPSRQALHGFLMSLTTAGILSKNSDAATYQVNSDVISRHALLGPLLRDPLIWDQMDLYYSKISALTREISQSLQEQWSVSFRVLYRLAEKWAWTCFR